MDTDIAIYIIAHKVFDAPKIDGYVTLYVGNKMQPGEFELCDRYGDNISDYNDSYCELTGLYWMWKNVDHDIIGLVHYRRYFAKIRGICINTRHFIINKKNAVTIWNKKMIARKLTKKDIIVKQSKNYGVSTERLFRKHKHVGPSNWERLRNVLIIMYPEYEQTFEQCANMYRHINCNMFIGKKKIIDEYCRWLFPLLKEMDKIQMEVSGDRYHNREMGYFAEILFGVWLRYNKINYTIGDVINLADDDVEDSVLDLQNMPKWILTRFLCRLKG